MLQKNIQAVDEKIEKSKQFREVEEILLNITDEKTHEIIIKQVGTLRDIIAEVAFMEGYKQGIREVTTEEVRENAINHLDLNQFNKLIEQAGIKQK